MSLSGKIDLAKDLFGTSSEPAQSVSRVYGTATADSSGGTVYVQIEDGDVIEAGTIGSISAGQTVTIHVQGGEPQVIAAEGWGDAIQSSVDEAVEVANATGQHFWEDDNGAHVTEVTREEWEDTTSQNYHAGYNSLWNSLGLLFRKALNNLVSITQSAVSFYDGSGNNAANVTASFGSSGAQIGKSGQSHITMDYRSLSLTDKDGNEYMNVSDMRGTNGYAEITQVYTGDGTTRLFVVSPSASSTSSMTVTVSDNSGGTVTKAPGTISFSSPPTNGATITITYTTSASDAKSYTFGVRGTGAVGAMSVAEGRNCVASGTWSHAAGVGTIAACQHQMAVGMYNTVNQSVTDPTLFVVGNGLDDNNRSNAFEVRGNGKVYIKETAFENMFVYETVDSGTIPSIAGNSTKWVDAWDISKTGYKAISIAGYYINGATTLSVYCMRFSDATHVQFAVRNYSSTATSSTNVKIEATILYVKAS